MRFLSCLTLAALLALSAVTPSFAAKKDRAVRDPVAGLEKKLQKADLPAEARAKATKVVAEHAAKIRAAHSSSEAILTAEQKFARAEALKKAKESGTKRKEMANAVAQALKLTAEQQTKYAAAQTELASAQAALQAELKTVLSADQQTKVGLKLKKKKNT
jgi:hypothetical protein